MTGIIKRPFKTIFLFVITILLSSSLFAQSNLVGVWQEGSPKISSAYLETYQFFPDGTFIYNSNQYDGLRKLISFGGDYKVNAGKIHFTVKYTVEQLGGNLERDQTSTGSSLWSFEGGEDKKIILKAQRNLHPHLGIL